jgi:hypothetical protein
MNLRTVGKIGFLLVVIGFLMPVACDQNGFELANTFIESQVIIGILMYLIFISAISGVILGVLLLQNKEVSKGLDWFCLLACIVSGLIVYFIQFEGGPELQSGAYIILTGWIIAFLSLIVPDSIFAKIKSENITNSEEKEHPDDPKNKYAIASLILGIIGLFIPLLSIIGIIMGVKGKKSLKRNMAITGLILSIIGIVVFSFRFILLSISK